MDESGRKAAEGDSPVEQQGIFSSPDLAVNSENLEEIKPELSEDNKSRIASAFAMTDATQKHDQLSEQMANQDAISGIVIPASNVTTSTATGDIKIPGAKKKSKLPIILAVLILLGVIGGVAAWFVLGRAKQDTAVSLKTAFNNYANFFLYNSESDADLEGLYQYGDAYYIGELNSEEQIDAHFVKAEEKYQHFLETYKKYIEQHPDSSIDVNVAEQIEPYYEDLDLLRYIKKVPNLTANDLLEAFSEAPDGLSTQIDAYYGTFAESSVENTRNYGTEYKNQLQRLLAAYQIYNVQGCLTEGVISLTCQQNTDDEQLVQANEIMAAFSAFYAEAVSTYRRISIGVYENIWVINLEIE